MVDVRCQNFNDDVWNYVTEYAKKKKISRCEALKSIVIEHMKFMIIEQNKRTSEI
jgi:hypothetical protein